MTEKRAWAKADICAWALLASVALAVGFVHVYFTIDLPNIQARTQLHQDIIAGTAADPYRYRVLFPFLAEVLLGVFGKTSGVFLGTYRVLATLAVGLGIGALYAYLRSWFSRDKALIGALFAGAMMVIPLRDHYFQPWSMLEPGLIALGLLLMYRRRFAALTAVVAIATLNRETAAILVVAFAASELLVMAGKRSADRTQWLRSLGWVGASAAAWAVAYFGIRLMRGDAVAVEDAAAIWKFNSDPQTFRYAVEAWVLFLGPSVALVPLGVRYAPPFVRRVAWAIPVLLAMFLVGSRWHETRGLMTVYAFAIPLALSFMYGDSARLSVGGQRRGAQG